MPLRTKAPIVLAAICLLSILWIGCSDNTIIRYVDGQTTQQISEVESYFPLNYGYTTIYQVSYATGYSERVTYRADDTTDIRGLQVISMIGVSGSSIDTGYFYVNGNALYYFRDKSSDPEKILELPFSNGYTWYSKDLTTDSLIDITTGTKNSSDSTGINAKTFPTISNIEYTVDNIESLELNNGHYYSNAVRISTPNGTKYNYYWYVGGVGLVRYVIGATTTSYPNGDIVGEILDYGVSR